VAGAKMNAISSVELLMSFAHVPVRRTLLAAAAATALAGCASWNPLAAGPDRTVVGQADAAVDVAAVQAAVDQGGTVRLKGTFAFGDGGQVRITRDVAIVGEADAQGRPLTTIRGGLASLRSLPPETLAGPGPKIEIRRIRFEGAQWTPIQLMHTSGAVVAGNVFTGVKPAAFPPGPISGNRPFHMQHGVIVGGPASEPGKSVPYRAGTATGRVSIADNEFDLANDVPRSTIAQAIFVVYTTGVQADIARNRIRNVSRNGIEAIDNFRGADGTGSITLRENDIESPADGAPFPTPRSPNGIVLGYFLDPSAAADPKRAVDHVVTRNTLRSGAQTSGSAVISILANGASVTDNRIVLAGPGIVGIVVAGSGNQVLRNRIEGAGALGIAVTPVPPLTASGNALVDNDFTALVVPRSAVALAKGADRNKVVGRGTVLDAGDGNSAQGMQPYVGAAR
jgi:hypothetical protein